MWIVACTMVTLGALGGDPKPSPVESLRILPPKISLTGRRDRQRIVVVARLLDGTTQDVTAQAKLVVDSAVARLVPGAVLLGAKSGRGSLTAQWRKQVSRATITVEHAGRRTPVSYANDVLPTLTRAGCNSGACHGAASGKNGFRLTLFGYDPGRDYVALTRELRGRRADPALPDASLMLTKPTTKVAHKGGKRFARGDATYARLREWIAAGAVNDLPTAAKLTGIEVFPKESVLAGAGGAQQLVVVARYADGSDRDVTELARLSSSSDVCAAIDARGKLTSKAPGEAFVLVRFGTFAVVSQVLVLDPKRTPGWPKGVRPINYIDVAIHRKLRKLRIRPAGVCSDAVFVRRAFLDIVNIVPTAEEARSFVADRRKDKRARLVDALLRRPGFADVWALHWAESLKIEQRRLERKGVHVYTRWLRDAFRDNVPFDRVVRALLTSTGGSFENPPANFFVTERDPKLIAENVAQAFMGVRVQCAQCHNHPFDRWRMDDYYGFAAFFARVTRKRGEDPRETVIFTRNAGEMRNPRTGKTLAPRFLGGVEPKFAKNEDRRKQLALWLTSKDNPWFARNVANRVFARFFGRGVVDPPDDVRVSNPPSHPGLHKELGRRLVAYGFDIRRLIRDICASRSYQLARGDGKAPPEVFANAPLRRLTAEQLLDSIGRVCDLPTRYTGVPRGARATELANGRTGNRFLELFGRSARQSACTCERRNEPTLAQALHLINGATIDARVRNGKSRLHRMLASKASDAAILDYLWHAAYGRGPTKREATRIEEAVASGNHRQAWEDVWWAVLNSKEFLFQH